MDPEAAKLILDELKKFGDRICDRFTAFESRIDGMCHRLTSPSTPTPSASPTSTTTTSPAAAAFPMASCEDILVCSGSEVTVAQHLNVEMVVTSTMPTRCSTHVPTPTPAAIAASPAAAVSATAFHDAAFTNSSSEVLHTDVNPALDGSSLTQDAMVFPTAGSERAYEFIEGGLTASRPRRAPPCPPRPRRPRRAPLRVPRPRRPWRPPLRVPQFRQPRRAPPRPPRPQRLRQPHLRVQRLQRLLRPPPRPPRTRRPRRAPPSAPRRRTRSRLGPQTPAPRRCNGANQCQGALGSRVPRSRPHVPEATRGGASSAHAGQARLPRRPRRPRRLGAHLCVPLLRRLLRAPPCSPRPQPQPAAVTRDIALSSARVEMSSPACIKPVSVVAIQHACAATSPVSVGADGLVDLRALFLVGVVFNTMSELGFHYFRNLVPAHAHQDISTKDDTINILPTRCSTDCLNRCYSVEIVQHQRYIIKFTSADSVGVVFLCLPSQIDDAKRVFEGKIDEYSVVLWSPFTECFGWALSRQPWPPPILFELTDGFQFRPTSWPPQWKMQSADIQLRPTPWPSFDFHIVVQLEDLMLLKFICSESMGWRHLFNWDLSWLMMLSYSVGMVPSYRAAIWPENEASKFICQWFNCSPHCRVADAIFPVHLIPPTRAGLPIFVTWLWQRKKFQWFLSQWITNSQAVSELDYLHGYFLYAGYAQLTIQGYSSGIQIKLLPDVEATITITQCLLILLTCRWCQVPIKALRVLFFSSAGLIAFGMHSRNAVIIVLFLSSTLWSFSLCWNLSWHAHQSLRWRVIKLVMHNQYSGKVEDIILIVMILSTYGFAMELSLEHMVESYSNSLRETICTPQKQHSWVGCHAKKLTGISTVLGDQALLGGQASLKFVLSQESMHGPTVIQSDNDASPSCRLWRGPGKTIFKLHFYHLMIEDF